MEFSVAEWSGPATFDGFPGYRFQARADDHGEPGTDDRYRIVISDESDVVYTIGGILDGGNFQIHRTNPRHP